MEVPVKSLAVANRFVKLATDSGKEITLLKLLKVVYFAHGWHLGLTGTPLLDEQVEAWKFGPVSPTIYHSFKEYGSGPITDLAMEFSIVNGRFVSDTPTIECPGVIDNFMHRIWDVYGPLSAFQLSGLTHQTGTPWHTVWYEMGGQHRKGTDIPDNLIAEYFKNKKAAQNG